MLQYDKKVNACAAETDVAVVSADANAVLVVAAVAAGIDFDSGFVGCIDSAVSISVTEFDFDEVASVDVFVGQSAVEHAVFRGVGTASMNCDCSADAVMAVIIFSAFANFDVSWEVT